MNDFGYCLDCRNWNQAGSDGPTKKGECRASEAVEVNGWKEWPITQHDDWCGAFIGDIATGILSRMKIEK